MKPLTDAHAISVLTEWDEFQELDFQRVFDSMQQPAFVFDGRNLLDRSKMTELGFEIHAIGKVPERRTPELHLTARRYGVLRYRCCA